eukprot:TRINITY_DN4887_c0_g3_i1.p1 TRINITY_DN4887_c0_g3~~TRINITY_DN4887_c0_g3_i1.p1  ORF type:complete len:650 (-),score=134.53 TRINITY_DN4887_c0_g3_i1:458-2407(-)
MGNWCLKAKAEPAYTAVEAKLRSLDIDGLALYLSEASNVVVMVGAGASTSCGIPDFRSPGTGLYDNLQKYNLPRPEAVFDLSYFQSNPEPFYDLAKEIWPGKHIPSVTHNFIKLLSDKNILRRCYTQNIDSLETAAGVPRELVVAAHGNFDSCHVVGTKKQVPVEELRKAIAEGSSGWQALKAKHGGLVKPSITFFGEALPDDFSSLQDDDFKACDLLIVIGTSLAVEPFANLVAKVRPDCPRVLINREPAGLADTLKGGFRFGCQDNNNDVFLQGDCDESVRKLCLLMRWDLVHIIEIPAQTGDCDPRFFSTTTGQWSLRSKGAQVREGSYEFHSGVLTDSSSKERIGTFSCDPIAKEALLFPPDPKATQPLQSIGITDSEIMSEIQKPSSDGAYFVLPSQLNGAEYPSHQTIVTRIQDYMTDNTGGPRGQLAVHPAAGQFVIDNAASDNNKTGINAIDAILQAASSFKLVNGYLQMPMPQDEREASDYLSSFMGSLHTLRPLVMADVQACGLTPNKAEFSDMKHKVNLVYASAVPVNTYLNRAQTSQQTELHVKVAEGVLVAQYYGALKTAAARTATGVKTTVFLMPLGGGVFNNPWESIGKSMSVAVEMLSGPEREKLNIQVLTWNGNPQEKDTMQKLLAQHNKLA